MKRIHLAASIALLLASAGALHAQSATYTWIGPSNGNWSNDDNWSPEGHPNGPSDYANFNAAGAAGSLLPIDVDGTFSLYGLNFNDKGGTGAGTNLNGGELNFSSYGYIGAGQSHQIVGSDITLNFFLNVSTGIPGRITELNGQISGRGALQFNGGGTVFLRGNNTFTDGVYINGGKVVADSNAALGNPDAHLRMNGNSTLELGGSFSGVRVIEITSGFIKGPQGIAPRGEGIGGTPTIDTHGFNLAATLIRGNPSQTPVSARRIGPRGTTPPESTPPVSTPPPSPPPPTPPPPTPQPTPPPPPTPKAYVRKTGAGTLTLKGKSSIDGLLADEGNVRVDGSIELTDKLELIKSAVLNGTGEVRGDVRNGGTVSPGNSPGTLTISGNYTQTSAGTLQIEIAGRNAGQFDLLAVGGKASLAGRAHFITLDNFLPQNGDRFTFLTAKKGLEGTFGTVDLDAPLLGGEVEYDADSATLVIVRLPIEPDGKGPRRIRALTPNQSAVAHVLDDHLNSKRLEKVFRQLDRFSAEGIPAALDQIAAEELSAIYELGIGSADIQGFNLGRHLTEVQAGRTGFSADRLAVATPDGKRTIAPDGKTSAAKDVFTPEPDNRWSSFIAGSGQWIGLDSDGNSDGYDITTGGLSVGADYRLSDGVVVGLLAGYARTDAELSRDGSLRTNSGKLGLYGSWFGNGCYLNGLVSGGYNDYDIKRDGLGGRVHGDTEGGEFNVLLSGGHDFTLGKVSIGPVIEGQYTRIAYDGFREHGSVAPLEIQDNDSDSLRSRLGARASALFQVGKVAVRPEVRLAWEHEYLDQSRPTDARFANGVGGVFRVEGPDHGRDSLLINASVTLLSGERLSTFVAYDGVIGRDNYDSHSVSGGVNWSF